MQRTSADSLSGYSEEKLQVLPPGSIAWSLLWLLFEVGQQVEIVYELTGEKVNPRRHRPGGRSVT
jgi:hypothetical protein